MKTKAIKMITPPFSLTATERVLPKLALDFTTASLDPRVTFTRALNTATRVNSSGYIETVNADVPRFDYSSTNIGVCKGLLIEESRSNLLTNSVTFASTWTAFGASLSTGAVTSPDGSASSVKYVEGSGVAEHGIFQTTTTGGTHAYSVYAKINGRRYLVLRKDGGGVSFAVFDLQAGAVTQTQNCTATIDTFGNGWYRCNLATTVLATGNTIIKSSDVGTGINPNSTYNGDGVSGFYLYGVQLENGGFSTSFIPTTSAALTRNADVATMTGTNFSSWYNQTAGTFSAQAIVPQLGRAGRILGVDSGTTANLFVIGTAATNQVSSDSVVGGAYSGGAYPLNTISANTSFKMCAAYSNTTTDPAALNGGAVGGGSFSVGTTMTEMYLGCQVGTSTFFNGCVLEINYWPQRLTNNEVQAFSK